MDLGPMSYLLGEPGLLSVLKKVCFLSHAVMCDGIFPDCQCKSGGGYKGTHLAQ